MTNNGFKDLFTTPEDKLGYLFWQINMLWVRKVNQSLQELGLTHTQFITLAATEWLNLNSERVIQRDIAEKLKVDRMLVSKMVSKLVDAELLQKRSSELFMDGVKIMKNNEREFFGLMEDDLPDLTQKLKRFLELAETDSLKETTN